MTKISYPAPREDADNAAFLEGAVSTNLLDRVGPAAFVAGSA